MGIQELEWIDVGDGASNHSVPGTPERRRSPAGAQHRRREKQPVPKEEIWQPKRPEGRRRQLSEEERIRRKKRRRRARIARSILLTATFFLIIGTLAGIAIVVNYLYEETDEDKKVQTVSKVLVEEQTIPQDIRRWGAFYATDLERPQLVVDLLTVNEYSRPGEALPEVKNVFIHYTANAGTTAEQNKSYFQSLAETHERSASAHFIIGYDGVIVQCIPTAEIAYAVKERNYDSISIECCFLDDSGIFTQDTYNSLLELTAWLLHKYELKPEDVLRHYDEGGKNCPKYYVEHEEAWRQFLQDLETYMERATDVNLR